MAMEPPAKPAATSLFQVYLRLRPPPSPLVQLTQQSLYPLIAPQERFVTVEPPDEGSEDVAPTQIVMHPPSDSRKRAVEKFAFTKVFEEAATQLDIFNGTGIVPLVDGVLGEGRDGLLATLGVTGSGKSHTILGSKSQRGLTQLSLDLLYHSIDQHVLHPTNNASLISTLLASDATEAQILPASGFLDGVYGDAPQERSNSRAPTPMTVGRDSSSSVRHSQLKGLYSQWRILGLSTGSLSPIGTDRKISRTPDSSIRVVHEQENVKGISLPPRLPFFSIQKRKKNNAKCEPLQDVPSTPGSRRCAPRRPSALPRFPDIKNTSITLPAKMEYAILISMYEVYNDRIYDLLTHSHNPKDLRRRALLFKSTETSPERKIVAGLRKIVCATYEEALMVLETGLTERRVAGTGSNSVSSRSHGFFCVEVKRRSRGGIARAWSGSQLTIVDLAGSERARNARTAGATLAEAGKINESLMYLGQCLQMQSDCHDGAKPSVVPFRQCKLTELLFSNSFPSHTSHHPYSNHHHAVQHRNPQKAIMIVTADPVGDFNATSQILRYSALAREVTVPRIPSVSSTILAGLGSGSHNKNGAHSNSSGRSSPSGSGDNASAEISELTADVERLNGEVEILAIQYEEERQRRKEAEEAWQRADERAEEIEREVREECWTEMETRIEEERRRWMASWAEEAERNGEHLDRKIEVLSRGICIHEDESENGNDHNSEPNRAHEFEQENDSLHRRLEILERELQCRSPTKSRPSKSSPSSYHLQSSPFPSAKPITYTQPSQSPLRETNANANAIAIENALNKLRDVHVTAEGKAVISEASTLSTPSGVAMMKTPVKVGVTAAAAGGVGAGVGMEMGSEAGITGTTTTTTTPTTTTTGKKKIRKLTARKWDLADEDELDAFGFDG